MRDLHDTIFFLDASLQQEKGGKMKTWFYDDETGRRYYCVDKSYKDGKGVTQHYRRKTTDPITHAKQVIEANSINGGDGSLTSKRFSECVSTYLQEKGPGGFSDICYRRASEELGRLYPDKNNFATAYSRYCFRLEASDMAVNTVNNHKIVIRTVCNWAYKTARCGHPTVRDWQLKKGNERNRVLSINEALSIENKFRELDSHLLMPFLFSLKNPIRKRDLFKLPRTALKKEVRDGTLIYYVEFQAKKTKRHIVTTTLPYIDSDFVRYEESLPADCPWLFPMVGTPRNGSVTQLQPGKWRKILDADRHFNTVLRGLGITDFKFHDLKHCAITYMLEHGYQYGDLGLLGIERSPKTQRLYDNRNQIDLIASKDIGGQKVGFLKAGVA